MLGAGARPPRPPRPPAAPAVGAPPRPPRPAAVVSRRGALNTSTLPLTMVVSRTVIVSPQRPANIVGALLRSTASVKSRPAAGTQSVFGANASPLTDIFDFVASTISVP